MAHLADNGPLWATRRALYCPGSTISFKAPGSGEATEGAAKRQFLVPNLESTQLYRAAASATEPKNHRFVASTFFVRLLSL
jgi:hypothetical protein